jgi:hypothetical protein
MRKLKVKTTDCSCDYLLGIAQKCGFNCFAGARHYKIKSADNKFITTIPRHNTISKYTVKGILKAFSEFGAKINEF